MGKLKVGEVYTLHEIVDELGLTGMGLLIRRIPRNPGEEDAVPGAGPCYRVCGVDDEATFTPWEIHDSDLEGALELAATEVLYAEE